MPSSTKKAKLDVASIAWEHYRNFLDSQEQDDNEEGDVDELEELLELLEPQVVVSNEQEDFTSIDSLLPVLCSVAHYHLASFAIGQTVDQSSSTDDKDMALHHLKASLKWFPQNAATWSIGANYARMTQRASPVNICSWYTKAAECASSLRTKALSLLEGDSVPDNVKEWIELMLVDGIVGAEYVVEGEECEEGQEQEEMPESSKSNGEKVSEDNEKDEEVGYFSFSSVEATSRFMAAMLLSTLGKHSLAQQNLQKFQLTHRLHPNVWKQTTTTASPAVSQSVGEPCAYLGNALPEYLYEQMCKTFQPDAAYWKESDYSHRGYYSYFFDVDMSKPRAPTNLIEEVILFHLLPRAKQVLAGSTEIVGAEWWPHTRPIQANLGHQLHFDTDEALLAQEGKITHPILSSVLYLTGNAQGSTTDNPAGATIVLNQTPDSDEVAQFAWKSVPRDNTYMIFPGNLLHGVLPCPGSTVDELFSDTTPPFELSDASTTASPPQHRLTFMVGFWTRRVPDKMKNRRLYGPCGPLPPATEEHSWVKDIRKHYPKMAHCETTSCSKYALPKVSPAWESLKADTPDPPLELPKAIDHRFFVQGAPQCFRDSLFQKDDEQ